jgi:uncharacterized protein YecE (DUF72 family)
LSILRIGTSGYTYSWNKGRPSPFRWYVNQGFNSVEINASYYRFSTEDWINTWLSAAPEHFSFSIKVNRYITDYTQLKGEKSVQLWNKFRKTLDKINDKIDFWLFKMPPSFKYTIENLETIRKFFSNIKLDNNNNNDNKAVVEFRDSSWWKVIDKIDDACRRYQQKRPEIFGKPTGVIAISDESRVDNVCITINSCAQ